FSLSEARSRSLVMGEQIGPPSRPSSPNPQERVLKCGWLKKQRSIMKNWQQPFVYSNPVHGFECRVFWR
uniref:Uncharacterized protein n=1 Tax=Serinus canaria TaxID=9135 RepID=A0A8C9NXN6_SERCA